MKFVKYLGLAGLLLAAGCAHDPGPVGGAPGLELVDMAALPPPLDADGSGGVNEYRLGPLDTVKIEVFGVEEFAREIQIDGSGKVTYPFVGEVQAGGVTPGELAEEIASGLRGRYIRDPQVSVSLIKAENHILTVDGEVREPGLYPVVRGMTLLRAIASAKGTTEFSKLEDVVIFRTVGEMRYVALYNLEAVRRGNYADPELYAGDVIVVGDSPARRRFQQILNASSLLVSPLVAVMNQL